MVKWLNQILCKHFFIPTTRVSYLKYLKVGTATGEGTIRETTCIHCGKLKADVVNLPYLNQA